MSTSRSSTETISQRIRRILKTERPWFNKVAKYIWIAFAVLAVGFPLYVFTVSSPIFEAIYGPMPSIREVENPENDLSSQLISADGASLGSYFRYNRSQVTYDEISPEMRNTLIISEDVRFDNHSGLDFIAYLRVLRGLATLNPAGGGSTITQQLAKNLYTMNPDRSLDGLIARLGSIPRRFVQKTKEWIISVKLEEGFTKEEILTMYLNTADFSSNSFGIKVAAETYFNKEPDSLNLQESAILVGMLQAPSLYNPKRNPENALRKRNEVLYKVYKEGYIIKTKEQFDSIKALPIQLKYNVQNQNSKIASYFRTVMGNWLMGYCKSKGIDLWNSGLKIYTTIDSHMQKAAEEAMAEQMTTLQKSFTAEWAKRSSNPWVDDKGVEIKDYLWKRMRQTDTYKNLVEKYGEKGDSVKIMLRLKKQMTVFSWKGDRDTLFSSMDSLNYYLRYLQSGLISMDPSTGFIKAWVGGINHKYFKYDHVKQGRRQPGSTFKPFVYGLAMENRYSPCHPMKDVAPVFKVPGGVWYPENSNGGRGNGDVMTLRQAMARSVNSITAQLLQALGAENVVDFAHRCGIESKLDPVPSLCLGTSDVSLYEMVGAYGTFVNSGIHTDPVFITRIEDKNGNVIENFVPKRKESIDQQTAYKMVYMLMGGVEEHGGSSSGMPADLRENNEIGAKTGTTDNASDGWYMAITHDLVSGVWVGGDERFIHYPSWDFGQGGKTAAPIWRSYMRKVYADPSTGIVKGRFQRPSDGLDVTLDCNRYLDHPDSVVVDEEPWDIRN